MDKLFLLSLVCSVPPSLYYTSFPKLLIFYLCSLKGLIFSTKLT